MFLGHGADGFPLFLELYECVGCLAPFGAVLECFGLFAKACFLFEVFGQIGLDFFEECGFGGEESVAGGAEACEEGVVGLA